MAAFTHKVPRQLQDEDRWFHIFTLKQAIAVGALAIVFVPVAIMLLKISLTVMVTVMVVYIMICGFLLFFKLPEGQYIFGGGQYGILLLYRIAYRYLHRCVYVKEGYDE